MQTEETAVNFDSDTEKSENLTTFAKVKTSKGEILSVNIISEGDPLEIYTDTNGEVIFKKYSPIGELSSFAEQYAEVLRRISPTLEEYIEKRKSFYAGKGGENALMPVEGVEKSAAVMYPIISAGDVTGSVIMLFNEEKSMPTETENKLIQTAAAFLAKQTED